jgi:hypothetical protein
LIGAVLTCDACESSAQCSILLANIGAGQSIPRECRPRRDRNPLYGQAERADLIQVVEGFTNPHDHERRPGAGSNGRASTLGAQGEAPGSDPPGSLGGFSFGLGATVRIASALFRRQRRETALLPVNMELAPSSIATGPFCRARR